MRDIKITFWIIILILISVFIYQNQHFFFIANQSFRVNLIFAEYKTPEIPSALIFLICILVGFFISYVVSIPGRMSSRKKIKLLQKAVDSQLKEISHLNARRNDSKTGNTNAMPKSIEKTHSTYR